MYNRFLKFINKTPIFSKHQFEFRDNHSTFMALIILIENLVNSMDNGKCAVGIFFDLQKSFWYCWSLYSAGQIIFLWYPWSGAWLVLQLFAWSPTISESLWYHQRSESFLCYSGAYIWKLIVSHIETDCAIGTFKRLCTALFLNSKEQLSNWIDQHEYFPVNMNWLTHNLWTRTEGWEFDRSHGAGTSSPSHWQQVEEQAPKPVGRMMCFLLITLVPVQKICVNIYIHIYALLYEFSVVYQLCLALWWLIIVW